MFIEYFFLIGCQLLILGNVYLAGIGTMVPPSIDSPSEKGEAMTLSDSPPPVLHTARALYVNAGVSDPAPDWIPIQMGQWIRIRLKWSPQKVKNLRNFTFAELSVGLLLQTHIWRF
jgi:hypothetical protein